MIDEREVVRRARRAWFLAGVRRRDRRLLRADLAAELAAAPTADVLGDDPGSAARDWARAREMADRRLRPATVVVPALLAGVVAAGTVLALLADGFSGDGSTVLGDLHPSEILAIYGFGGLLATIAMIAVAGGVLRALGDTTAMRTVRALTVALPLAGVLATASAVSIANAFGYVASARTLIAVVADVVAFVSLGIVAARWQAVRPARASRAS